MKKLLILVLLSQGYAGAQVQGPSIHLKEAIKDFPRSELQLKTNGPVSIEVNQGALTAYETLAEMAGLNILVDRDFRSEGHRAESVDDDAGEAGHLCDVFIDVDGIAIAGCFRIAIGLIVVDSLRDDEVGLSSCWLDDALTRGACLRVAIAATSDERAEDHFRDALVRLVGGVERDVHGLATGLGFDRSDLGGGVDDIAGANRA